MPILSLNKRKYFTNTSGMYKLPQHPQKFGRTWTLGLTECASFYYEYYHNLLHGSSTSEMDSSPHHSSGSLAVKVVWFISDYNTDHYTCIWQLFYNGSSSHVFVTHFLSLVTSADRTQANITWTFHRLKVVKSSCKTSYVHSQHQSNILMPCCLHILFHF
jgi:hypothetical protein